MSDYTFLRDWNISYREKIEDDTSEVNLKVISPLEESNPSGVIFVKSIARMSEKPNRDRMAVQSWKIYKAYGGALI